MNLSVPKYLEASNCQANSLHHAWDDRKSLPELESLNEELVARLAGVSQRAVLAFASGSAEWLVYRFERLTDTTDAWDFIQTAWAMTVHPRYCVGFEFWSYETEKGWEGPVRRPIRMALEFLDAAFYLLTSEYHTDPTSMTASISALTTYVMTDPAPYQRWVEDVLYRFEGLYPRDPRDPLGDVVPRQAVDPDVHFSADQAEALINQFLATLDHRSNRFLRDPAAILEPFEGEEDFKGTPYVFDIDGDRTSRRGRATGEHHHE